MNFDNLKFCPYCRTQNIIKNGKIAGKQRYKCKECNLQFTKPEYVDRARSTDDLAMALVLRDMGHTFKYIGQYFNISANAVFKWVKKYKKMKQKLEEQKKLKTC